MNVTGNMTVLLVVAAILSACGNESAGSSASGVSPSLSASAGFDATGTWTTKFNRCSSIPVQPTFINTIQTLVGDVQAFTTGGDNSVPFDVDGDGDDESVVVTQSEGTLDTTTGAYRLCYASTLSDCQIDCNGTVDSTNTVGLTCVIAASGATCNITIQK